MGFDIFRTVLIDSWNLAHFYLSNIAGLFTLETPAIEGLILYVTVM